MNGVALCAGYGGLELGIERVLPGSRTVCYVEGECFAVQHLVKKMEEGSLDAAPIWSNVKTFDGKPWRGKVDWISGGFPCQPYSGAGKQLGEEDPRDLWLDFVRIIGEVRPGFLFFENVPNIVNLRLDQIVIDLDKLGYHASWCVVAASDVGALHRRRRWFLLGVRHVDSNTDNPGECTSGRAVFQKDRHNPGGFCQVCRELANTYNEGLGSCKPGTNGCTDQESRGRNSFNPGSRKNVEFEGSKEPSNIQENVPNSGGIGSNEIGELQTRNEETKPKVIGGPGQSKFPNTCGQGLEGAISQEKRGGLAGSCRGMEDEWGGRFNEWWKVEPGMGRLVDGTSDWVDKLRLLGNGVVPQQAAYAFQILGERLAAGIVEKRTPRD